MKVSESAVVQRIRRRLRHDGERLVKARRYEPTLGDWYVLDGRNIPTCVDIELEGFARELDVLSKWETMV